MLPGVQLMRQSIITIPKKYDVSSIFSDFYIDFSFERGGLISGAAFYSNINNDVIEIDITQY